MKETKKFFENNRLNRGNAKVYSAKQSDEAIIRKKHQHILPPIDVMEQYEELHPGTLEKLIEMSQKEQAHRHKMDVENDQTLKKSMSFGRVFSLIFVALVAVCSMLIMFAAGSIILASIFVASAFLSIIVIAYLSLKSQAQKIYSNYRYNNQGRNKNYRSGHNQKRR